MSLPTRPIQVAVVADSATAATSCLQPLQAQADFRILEILGANAESALRAMGVPPDVVVLEFSEAAAAPHGLLPRLRHAFPNLMVIVHSARDDFPAISSALRAGADGYVLSGDPLFPMEHAIREVKAGGVPLSRPVACRIGHHFRTLGIECRLHGLDALTSREIQVLERIHAGFTNAEIGQALHVSVETVRKAVRSILSKLHVANRAEAAGLFARLDIGR